ncbi:MAG: UPF0104 family protein [Synechococcus sp.]
MRKLPGGLRLWVTLASLGFVAWALARDGHGLRDFTLSARGWWWLLLGLSLSCLSLVVNAVAWRQLVLWLGHGTDGLALVPLHLRTNLLKYLPGGIWHFVDRLRTLQPRLGTNQALVSVLLEPVVMAVAALLWVPLGGWQSGLALVAVVPALVLVTRWREPLLVRLERAKWKQFQRANTQALAPLDPDHLGSGRGGYPWGPLGWEMVFVLCRFAGFWSCVLAFELGAVPSLGFWLAGFVLAWTVGLVVPAAPGGLGVFETVLLLRFGSLVGEAPLPEVVFSYRLVVTVADVLAAGVVQLMHRWLPVLPPAHDSAAQD